MRKGERIGSKVYFTTYHKDVNQKWVIKSKKVEWRKNSFKWEGKAVNLKNKHIVLKTPKRFYDTKADLVKAIKSTPVGSCCRRRRT